MILNDSIYLIIGTGTDIGKTFLLENICRKLKKAGTAFDAIKPVISGFSADDPQSDSAKILNILGKDLSKENFDTISPWRFSQPISPNLAAQKENKTIDFLQVVNFCQEKINQAKQSNTFLFIESAGGAMTPITDDKTYLDLAEALHVNVILLGANYLGSISHSLCTIEALRSRHITPEIILINDHIDKKSDTNIAQTVAVIENISKIKTLPLDVFLI